MFKPCDCVFLEITEDFLDILLKNVSLSNDYISAFCFYRVLKQKFPWQFVFDSVLHGISSLDQPLATYVMIKFLHIHTKAVKGHTYHTSVLYVLYDPLLFIFACINRGKFAHSKTLRLSAKVVHTTSQKAKAK